MAGTNERFTPDMNTETHFRQDVRDILNLDWSARDFAILEELRRLKAIEARVVDLEARLV